MNRADLKPFWRKHHYLAALFALLIMPLFLVASVFHAFWNCSPVLTRYFEETFENIADSFKFANRHLYNPFSKENRQGVKNDTEV